MANKKRNYGKVFNLCTSEKKQNIVASKLIKIDYEGVYNTIYNEGDVFNPNGLTLIAYFFDGDTLKLPYSDSAMWKYYPVGPLKESDTFITLKYSEGERTATKKIPITVKKTYVKRPKVVESEIFYNNNIQSPEIINLEPEYVTLSGDLEKIKVGEYTIKATVNDTQKYSFEPLPGQETSNDKTIELKWSIKKAPRPFSLSNSKVYYDEDNKFDEFEVYLNYPGDTLAICDRVPQDTSPGFDVDFIAASKKIIIKPLKFTGGLTGYHKQVYRIYVPSDDNSQYEQSETLELSIICNIWDWGEENKKPVNALETYNWVQGLGRRVQAGKADKNWIGKKKYFFGTRGIINPISKDSGTLQFTCVDINRDGDNTVTFITSFTSYKQQTINKPDTNTWPDKGGFDEPENTFDNNIQHALFRVENLATGERPGAYVQKVGLRGTANKNFRQYIKPCKKLYWTGEKLAASEQEFWIPSLAELGVINLQEAPNYIGGFDAEFTEGVATPYSYFISGKNSRIKTTNDSTNKVSYWTRSTADNVEGERSQSIINRNAYAIDSNGSPIIQNKTNQNYIVFGFTLDFNDKKEMNLDGESI